MKEILGHIFGTDLNEINFVCDSETRSGESVSVELGEILIIDDHKTKDRYLARVTNVKYGQKPEWAQERARGKNRLQDLEEISDEHESPQAAYKADRREQLFLTPVCELLGYINGDGKFLTPKRLPAYFSPIRKPGKEDFKFLEEYLGDIRFGNVRSGSNVIPVGTGLFGELLPKHIGVFAQTGGGKSNTMNRLVGSVLESEGKFGLLIFDPHGEYVHKLKKHPYATKDYYDSYSINGKNANKIQIHLNEVSVEAVMNLSSRMNWTEPQIRFMSDAESILKDEWFRVITEIPFDQEEAYDKGMVVPQTLDEIFGIKKGSPYENTLRAVKSKLMGMRRAPYFTSNPSQNRMNNIMASLTNGKVVLIDMSGLSGLHEILLSSIFAGELLKRRKIEYGKDPEAFEQMPPVSIVMEEAQRVLGRSEDREGNVFAQICNEGRKFGVGLVAITQQPKLMNDVLISQFNTLIILSISDEKDFDILSGISKKPLNKLRTEIRSLMPGEAIMTSPKAPFALPMKVELYDDYIKRLKKPRSNKISKEKFKGMV